MSEKIEIYAVEFMEVMTMLMENYEYVSTVLSENEERELFNLKKQIEDEKNIETVVVNKQFLSLFQTLEEIHGPWTLN